MNNELSSLLLQIIGLIIVGLFAWRIKKKRYAIIFGIIFMFIINFVAQVVIAGEGPGAFAGAFILPFYGVIVAWICVSLSLKKENKVKEDDSDEQQKS